MMTLGAFSGAARERGSLALRSAVAGITCLALAAFVLAQPQPPAPRAASVADGFDAETSSYRLTLPAGTHFLFLPLAYEDTDLVHRFGPEWPTLDDIAWWDASNRRWSSFHPAFPVSVESSRAMTGQALRVTVSQPTRLSLLGSPPTPASADTLKQQASQEFLGVGGTRPFTSALLQSGLPETQGLERWDVASGRWVSVDPSQPATFPPHTLFHLPQSELTPLPTAQFAQGAAPAMGAAASVLGSSQWASLCATHPNALTNVDAGLAASFTVTNLSAAGDSATVTQAVSVLTLPPDLVAMTDLPGAVELSTDFGPGEGADAPRVPIASHILNVSSLTIAPSSTSPITISPPEKCSSLDLLVDSGGRVMCRGLARPRVPNAAGATTLTSEPMQVDFIYDHSMSAAVGSSGPDTAASPAMVTGPTIDLVLSWKNRAGRVFRRWTRTGPAPSGQALSEAAGNGIRATRDWWLSMSPKLAVTFDVTGAWLARTARVTSLEFGDRNALAAVGCEGLTNVRMPFADLGTLPLDEASGKAARFTAAGTLEIAVNPSAHTTYQFRGKDFIVLGRWGDASGGAFEIGCMPSTGHSTEPGPNYMRKQTLSLPFWFRGSSFGKSSAGQIDELLLCFEPKFQGAVTLASQSGQPVVKQLLANFLGFDFKNWASDLHTAGANSWSKKVGSLFSGLNANVQVGLASLSAALGFEGTVGGTRVTLAGRGGFNVADSEDRTAAAPVSFVWKPADWYAEADLGVAGGASGFASAGAQISYNKRLAGPSRTAVAVSGAGSLPADWRVTTGPIAGELSYTHEDLTKGHVRNSFDFKLTEIPGTSQAVSGGRRYTAQVRDLSFSAGAEQATTTSAATRSASFATSFFVGETAADAGTGGSVSEAPTPAGALVALQLAAPLGPEAVTPAISLPGALRGLLPSGPSVFGAPDLGGASAQLTVLFVNCVAGGIFKPVRLHLGFERESHAVHGALDLSWKLPSGKWFSTRAWLVKEGENPVQWGAEISDLVTCDIFTLKNAYLIRTGAAAGGSALLAGSTASTPPTTASTPTMGARMRAVLDELVHGQGWLLGADTEWHCQNNVQAQPIAVSLLYDQGSRTGQVSFAIPTPATVGLPADYPWQGCSAQGTVNLNPPKQFALSVDCKVAPPTLATTFTLTGAATATLTTPPTWSLGLSASNVVIPVSESHDATVTLDQLGAVLTADPVNPTSTIKSLAWTGQGTVQLPRTWATWAQSGSWLPAGVSIPSKATVDVSGNNRSFTVAGSFNPQLGVQINSSLSVGIGSFRFTKASPWKASLNGALTTKGQTYALPIGFGDASRSLTLTLPATQTIGLDFDPGPEVQVQGGELTLSSSGTVALTGQVTVAIGSDSISGKVALNYSKTRGTVACSVTPSQSINVGGFALTPGPLAIVSSRDPATGKRVNAISGTVTAMIDGRSFSGSLSSSGSGVTTLTVSAANLDFPGISDFLTVTNPAVRYTNGPKGTSCAGTATVTLKMDELGISQHPTFSASLSRDSSQNTTFTIATPNLSLPLGFATVNLATLKVSNGPSGKSLDGSGSIDVYAPINLLFGKDAGTPVSLPAIAVSYKESTKEVLFQLPGLNYTQDFNIFGLCGSLGLSAVAVSSRGSVDVGLSLGLLGFKLQTAPVLKLRTTAPKISGDLRVTDQNNAPVSFYFDYSPLFRLTIRNLSLGPGLLPNSVAASLSANMVVGTDLFGFRLDAQNASIPLQGPRQVFFDELSLQANMLGFGTQATVANPLPDFSRLTDLASSSGVMSMLSAAKSGDAKSAAESLATTVLNQLVGANPIIKGPGLGRVALRFPQAEFQYLFPNSSPFVYQGSDILLYLMSPTLSGDGFINGIFYPTAYALQKLSASSPKAVAEVFRVMFTVIQVVGSLFSQPSNIALLVPEDKRSGSFNLNLILSEAAGGYQLTPKAETNVSAQSAEVKKFFLLGRILDYLKQGSQVTGFKSMDEIVQGLRVEERRSKEQAELLAAARGVGVTQATTQFTSGVMRGSAHFFADLTGDGKADAILLSAKGMLVCPSDGKKFIDGAQWSGASLAAGNLEGFAPLTGAAGVERFRSDNGHNMQRFSYPGGTESAFTNWGPIFNPAATRLLPGDVDGDGRAEVVGVAADTLVVARAAQDSAGGNGYTRGLWNTSLWLSNGGSGLTALADVDGDGKADAIFVGSTQVLVRRSTGTTFEAAQVWTSTFGSDREPLAMFFSDVNGDGRADLVVVSRAGNLEVAPSTGTSYPALVNWESSPSGTPFAVRSGGGALTTYHAADVNGDGRTDLIALDPAGVRMAFSRGNRFEVTDSALPAVAASSSSALASVTQMTMGEVQDRQFAATPGVFESFPASVIATVEQAMSMPSGALAGLVEQIRRSSGAFPTALQEAVTDLYHNNNLLPKDYPTLSSLVATGSTSRYAAALEADLLSTNRFAPPPGLFSVCGAIKAARMLGVTPQQLCVPIALASASLTARTTATTYQCSPSVGNGQQTRFRVVDRWIDTSNYVQQARDLETKWNGLVQASGSNCDSVQLLSYFLERYQADYGAPTAGWPLTWNAGNIQLTVTGRQRFKEPWNALGHIINARSDYDWGKRGQSQVDYPTFVGNRLKPILWPTELEAQSHFNLLSSPMTIRTSITGSLSWDPGQKALFFNPSASIRYSGGNLVNFRDYRCLEGLDGVQNLGVLGQSVLLCSGSSCAQLQQAESTAYPITGWRLTHVLRDPANPDIADFSMSLSDRGTVLFKGPSGMRYCGLRSGKTLLSEIRSEIEQFQLVTGNSVWDENCTSLGLLLRVWYQIWGDGNSELSRRYSVSARVADAASRVLKFLCVPRSNPSDQTFDFGLSFDWSQPALIIPIHKRMECHGGLGCFGRKFDEWQDAPFFLTDFQFANDTLMLVGEDVTANADCKNYCTWTRKGSVRIAQPGELLNKLVTKMADGRLTYNVPAPTLSDDLSQCQVDLRLASNVTLEAFSSGASVNHQVWLDLSRPIRLRTSTEGSSGRLNFSRANTTLVYSCDDTGKKNVPREVRLVQLTNNATLASASDGQTLSDLLESGDPNDHEIYPLIPGDYLVRGYISSNRQMVYATSVTLEQDLRDAIGAKILYRQVIVTEPANLAGSYLVDTGTLASSQPGAAVKVISDSTRMSSVVAVDSTSGTVPPTVTIGNAEAERSLGGEHYGQIAVVLTNNGGKPAVRHNPVTFTEPGASGVPEGFKFSTGIVPDPGGLYAWASLKSPDWFKALGSLAVDLKGAIKDGGYFLFQGLINATVLGTKTSDGLIRFSSVDGVYLRMLINAVIQEVLLEGRINTAGIFMLGTMDAVKAGTGIRARITLDSTRNPIVKGVGQILVASADIARVVFQVGKSCLQMRFSLGNDDVGVDARLKVAYQSGGISLCVEGRAYFDTFFGRIHVSLPTIFVDAGSGNWGASLLLGICGNIPSGDIYITSSVSRCAGYGSACGDCN